MEIPRPHLEHCSKHILVMDCLDGIKLVDGIRREFGKVAKLTGRSVADLEREFREQIEAGTFVFKTIEQSRTERWQLEWLLATKDVLSTNLYRFLFNVSPARLLYKPYEYQWTDVPMDLGSVVELLCQVHGNQIFEHGEGFGLFVHVSALFQCISGAFNGDPHPGNILLLRDGRLGLIDYGQVKRMTVDERVKYAKLMIAHARGDKAEVIRIHFDELGVRTKRNDPEVGYLMSCFYNDRDTKDVCDGRNIPEFLDYLEARDPMVQLSEAYLFASRVNVMLRGLGKAFGLQMRMGKIWEKEASDFLKSQGVDY